MEQQPELSADVPRAWDRPVVTVPILAFLSVVGGQLPSFSTQANLYTIGTGGALVWLGLSSRMPRRPVPQRLGSGAIWWLLPVTVFGVFEASTFMLGSSDDYPTFSKLADPLLEDSLARSAGYFAWLSAFWVLVRR
ncbi:hypothetical protein [Plantactinospora sp. CA-290183]|uniref:hypothetical protein n=1 Tax=Plantactinospora sp. CA-290183 TaxID=3240006 RepID=UPI003D8B4BF8